MMPKRLYGGGGDLLPHPSTLSLNDSGPKSRNAAMPDGRLRGDGAREVELEHEAVGVCVVEDDEVSLARGGGEAGLREQWGDAHHRAAAGTAEQERARARGVELDAALAGAAREQWRGGDPLAREHVGQKDARVVGDRVEDGIHRLPGEAWSREECAPAPRNCKERAVSR
eukprot:scaffold217087_cov31-Tisochrysis_lutea.AAC.2